MMKNKTILITGGNEGIGLATAIVFAKQGANVAIMGRRADKNAAALKAVEATGAKCIAITGDVSKAADMSAAVKKTVDTFGGLHFGFNNAGIPGSHELFAEASEDDFDSIMAVNVKGVWLAMKYELPAIKASGGGAIVNTGSSGSLIGLANMPAYTGSKHAVVGMTKSAAMEYAQQGVRVNVICPGIISDTGIHDDMAKKHPGSTEAYKQAVPMKRYGTPEEIGGSVLYLCSDAAAYMTGHVLCVDGGLVP